MTADELKKQILFSVRDELSAIENALAENLKPRFDLVREVAGHILFSGGKRLRPLLMILSARLCNYHDAKIVYYATLFEYLHAATLIHDDIVDGGGMRRGRTAAHLKYGHETAVLTGDFLLARSVSLACETNNPEIVRVVAGITEDMSQGELAQLDHKKDVTLTEKDYREVIRRKTAVLFQGACRIGTMIAGADRDTKKILDDLGYHLGMAFQMADDLLDYSISPTTLGKNPGTDIREGKLTLPLIYVIQTLNRAENRDLDFIHKMIRNPDFSTDEFNRLCEMLVRYKGIDYTKKCAETHVTAAREILSHFHHSKTRTTLERIAAYTLLRRQ